MPGKRIVSDRQMMIMLDYMEAYPEFAKGSLPNVTTPALKNENLARWQNLACSLNAAGSGCKKNVTQWREYWNSLKYSARSKACKIRKQLKELMKGECLKLLVLSNNEKRVLSILGIPLPELPFLVECPPDTTQPNAPPPDTSPRETSPRLGTPPQAMSQPQVKSGSVSSESDNMSGSISPLLERRPPPNKAWAQAVKRKAAYESATSTTRVYSTPYGSTARKRYRPAEPPASEWVRHIEERRIAVEERSSRALQGIQANTEFCASALQGIHIAQERMNATLQGIQSALEASAMALQGRHS